MPGSLACPERSRRDPQIGRFLGVDPLADAQGQQIYSPYAAMGNMSESCIDPDGMAITTYTGSDAQALFAILQNASVGGTFVNGQFRSYGDVSKQIMAAVMQGVSGCSVTNEYLEGASKGFFNQTMGIGSGGGDDYFSDGSGDDGKKKEVSQSDGLMATNLPPSRAETAASQNGEAVLAVFNETTANLTPMGLLNLGAKVFTGKNIYGDNSGDINTLEAVGPPVGKVNKLSKIATVEEQAAELSSIVGKNSVKIKTVEGQTHFDLVGAIHKGVPTPHIQKSFWNTNPTGKIFLNKDRQWVRSMTQQDIRILRNYLKKLP